METFNVLLRGIERYSSKDVAMFLAGEMSALGIKANELTYDRFILVCVKAEDYEDAFRYLEEMMEVGADVDDNGEKTDKGWWMRKGTASNLARRCICEGDERGWLILKEMEERGMGSPKLKSWAVGQWKGRENMLDAARLKESSWAP